MINNDFENLKLYRNDGRNPCDFKNISLEFGLKEYFNYFGSCYYKSGLTEIICFVDSNQNNSNKFIDLVWNMTNFYGNKRNKFERIAKEWSHFIENLRLALEENVVKEKLQNNRYKIIINIIKSNGSLKASIINAVNLALVDSGIPIKGLMVGISSVVPKFDNENVLIDPNNNEELNSKGEIIVAYLPLSKKICLLETKNLKLVPARLTNFIEKTLWESNKLYEFFNTKLKENYWKKFLWNL